MKKIKIIAPALACSAPVLAATALTGCSCGVYDNSHIVQPTDEEKQPEIEAGAVTATYTFLFKESVSKNTLKKPTIESQQKISNDSTVKTNSTTNADVYLVSVDSYECIGKRCFVTVKWIGSKKKSSNCSFSMVFESSKGWTEKVADCRFNYIAPTIENIAVSGAIAIGVGNTSKYYATVTGSGVSQNVTWSLGDGGESYASIDAETGILTAKKVGTVYVIATSKDITTKSSTPYEVSILCPALTGITINQTSVELKPNKTSQLSITSYTPAAAASNIKSIKYQIPTSQQDVATVNSSGLITAKSKAGTATVYVTVTDNYGNVAIETCQVTVTIAVTGISMNKSTASVDKGGTVDLIATLSYNADEDITWTNSNPSIVTMAYTTTKSGDTNTITASSTTGGTSTITATCGSYSTTCTITVNKTLSGIAMDKTTATIDQSATVDLIATLSYNADEDITWTNSNPSIVTMASTTTKSGVANKITAGTTAGTATITATCGEYSATCTVTVNIETFAQASWTDIISAINTFENSAQDETAMKALCDAFSHTEYIESPTTGSGVEDHLANFIGKTHELEINGQKHTVRIIGVNHDTLETAISGNAKATFTFELVTLLSDNDGAAMNCEWDSYNYDYTNSKLRANLTGSGTASKKTWNNTALQMLPSELQSVIKTVQKHVAISTDSGSTYIVSDYNDELFPLTYTEMAQSDSSYAKVEGSAYMYWTNNKKSKDARIKKDVNGNDNQYWLCSPNTQYNVTAWDVDAEGYVYGRNVGYSDNGVSFAFCI